MFEVLVKLGGGIALALIFGAIANYKARRAVEKADYVYMVRPKKN